jgi:DNA-binding transcriptional regulator YhcF (GntR family)
MSTATPAGNPEIHAISACPWDSPAVTNRSICGFARPRSAFQPRAHLPAAAGKREILPDAATAVKLRLTLDQRTFIAPRESLRYPAMRFWIARNSEVPIREQIVTQIVLGILCDDLKPDQRLPSTRELARRFRLHPNTVSAAYRQLERDRWVQFRRGSGVYVRKDKPDAPPSSALALDQLIANFFRAARELGAPLSAIHVHLQKWLAQRPPDHFLLIEPDEELRKIVLSELQQALTFSVAAAGLEACRVPDQLAGAIPVALPSKTNAVRQALPEGVELLTLRFRSVPASLDKWLPAPSDALIGVASRWPGFLKMARTMLLAAGFHADSLVFRDARQPHWQQGLKQTAAVVCDSLTAKGIPRGCLVILFPLVSDSAIEDLRRHQDFAGDPIGHSV